MIAYRRARAALVVALVFAAVMIGTGFPLGTLLHQRSEIAASASELAEVRAHNSALSSEITSLSHRSTIVDIAREEYGLVQHGQQAVVILPGAGDPAIGAGSLVDRTLPAADLVPTSSAVLGATQSKTVAGPRALVARDEPTRILALGILGVAG